MRARADAAIVAVVLGAAVAIAVAVWVASGVQAEVTDRAAERQAAGAALLTGMLDQETGVRGFIGNGRDEFLAPYRAGRREFARALADSRRLGEDGRRGRTALSAAATQARQWQSLALAAIAKVRRDGRRSTTVGSALRRKAAMDRFRRSQIAYARWADSQRTADVARARRYALLVVLALALVFSVAGVFVVRWVRSVRAVKELRYQRLVRSLPDAGVLTFDRELRFTSVDGSALEALGWVNDEVVGVRLEELVSAEQLALVGPRYRAALAGDTQRFEFDSDPTAQSWAVEVSPLRRDDGDVLGGLVMLRNITERRAAERDVERRTRDMETLGTAAREMASAGNASDVQRSMCVAAQRIADSLTAAVWLPDGRGQLISEVAVSMAAPTSTIATADRSSGVAATFRSGKPLLVADAGTSGYCDAAAVEATACASVYFAPIAGDDGPVGVLALSWSVRQAELSDRLQVTLDTLCHEGAVALDRVALLERLDDLASTDPLTGLANRRVWDERMNLEMRRARGHQEPLAVAILDIDHFKAYNDSRGHPAGDRLLRTLSASLTARLRDTDTVARLGGEEFGVLLPRCGSETAQELLYRLRNAIPDGQTCSAGYAIWDHAETAEQLLKRADEALYQAKRDGRDRTRAAEAV